MYQIRERVVKVRPRRKFIHHNNVHRSLSLNATTVGNGISNSITTYSDYYTRVPYTLSLALSRHLSPYLDIVVSAVHLVLDFEGREPETDVLTFLRRGQPPVAIFVVVVVFVAVGGVRVQVLISRRGH